jgi:hypothetical protein
MDGKRGRKKEKMGMKVSELEVGEQDEKPRDPGLAQLQGSDALERIQ